MSTQVASGLFNQTEVEPNCTSGHCNNFRSSKANRNWALEPLQT